MRQGQFKLNSWSFTCAELGSFLRMLGHEVSEEEVVQMVQVFDTDGSGDIGFPEFVQLIRQQVLVKKDSLKCFK